MSGFKLIMNQKLYSSYIGRLFLENILVQKFCGLSQSPLFIAFGLQKMWVWGGGFVGNLRENWC